MRTVVAAGTCHRCGTKRPAFRLVAPSLARHRGVADLVMLVQCDCGWVPVPLGDVSLDPNEKAS